ncbi:hypothetical protein B1A99_06945 [Cohnella sp. CIP 111063]|uniref:response regulator n=1 Tax=unclassified Cohnella TaxID=2636738 RepID=UPI000B8C38AA|nr:MULTISPECIES: response regulator [unclassified Cohnella]OXS61241.1 hypothetical protein B1A99_06945 [Cohnella sp. CIP 111063]PRX73814.1 helix-turn-helix protein [Cohnella sp. SGD-V74]
MTYKVMIIDDEPWIVKDLVAMLDWEARGFSIAAVSSDATEAEFLAGKQAPDLILCDIRMPGMSGLELMERLKRRHPGVVFLFMSAYSEFSYAVRAVQLGAFDYLIKPVGTGMLEAALDRVTSALSERNRERAKAAALRNTLLMLELLDGGLPHRAAAGRLAKEALFRPAGGPYRLAIAHADNPHSSERLQERLALLADRLTDDDPAVSLMIGQSGAGKWFALIGRSDRASRIRLSSWRSMRRQFEEEGIALGVSSAFTGLDRIKLHYREAERMARMRWMTGRAGMYIYRAGRSGGALLDFVDRIRMTSHYAELGALLGSVASRCVKEGADPDTIAAIYNETIRQSARLDGWLKEQEVEECSVEELLALYPNPDKLFEELIAAVRKPAGQDGENDSRIVAEVLREIERNYNRRLSLTSIAAKHYINANYLSQLFKQKTGRSFKQHLVETRMAKAAELLQDSGMTLQEISGEVGYDDYFHFSKLFKKYRGISPADLRKMR